MQRVISAIGMLLVLTPLVMAQDDYKKYEFFGGYSTMSFDNLGGDTNNAVVNEVFGEKSNLRGLNLAITRNFHKYFGAKFDYSLHLR